MILKKRPLIIISRNVTETGLDMKAILGTKFLVTVNVFLDFKFYWSKEIFKKIKMYVQRHIEASSHDHFFRGNQYVTYFWVCVCSLLLYSTQSVSAILYSYLSSVACLALPYFSTLSHKQHDFWKKLLKIKCTNLFFSTNFSEIFLILRRIQQDIFISVRRSSCKVPVILLRF